MFLLRFEFLSRSKFYFVHTHLVQSDMDTITVGRSIAIAQYDVPKKGYPRIHWDEGVIEKIVDKVDDQNATVMIHFKVGSPDNKYLWALESSKLASSFNDVTIEDMKSTILKKSGYLKWRITNNKTPATEPIILRVMERIEVVEMIKAWQPATDMETLKKKGVQELVRAFKRAEASANANEDDEDDEGGEDGQDGQDGQDGEDPGNQVRNVDDPSPSKRRRSGNDKTVATTVVTRKDIEEIKNHFDLSINNHTAEIMSLKSTISDLRNKISVIEGQMSVVYSNVETVTEKAKTSNNSLKLALLPFKQTITSKADAEKCKIPVGLVNNATTVVNKSTFYRCKRLVMSSNGESLCISKTPKDNGDGTHVYVSTGDRLPLCIMELRPDIHEMSFCDAHGTWLLELMCKSCAITIENGNPKLRFIKKDRTTKKPPKEISGDSLTEFIWKKVCLFCYKNEALGINNVVDAPACQACVEALTRAGNGGDNRAIHIFPVEARFPDIDMRSVTWKNYCTVLGTDDASAANHFKGPDTVLTLTIRGMKGIILLEEDANMHADRGLSTETSRITLIAKAAISDPQSMCLIIRYSPDVAFKTATEQQYEPSKAVRMLIIRAWVTWWIKNVRTAVLDMPRCITLFMFYHTNHQKFLDAKKDLEQITEDGKKIMVVGQAHTTPQEVISEKSYDWRYALTPNEGLVYADLARNGKNGILPMPVKHILPNIRIMGEEDEEATESA